MLLVSSGQRAYANDATGPLADSLHTVLPSLEGEAKLNALREIAESERDAGAGLEAEEHAIEQLLKEARLQKNRDMEARALLMLLFCYHNHNETERYYAFSEGIGEFYLDNGYMDLYWEYLFLDVRKLLYANRQEEAIKLTGEMYDMAKSADDMYGLAVTEYLMGKAYQVADKRDAAREAFLEAWSYLNLVKDPLKRMKLIYYCATALVIEFNNIQAYDRSLEILEEWSGSLEESRIWDLETNGNTYMSDISQIYCDMLRTETYTHMGSFKEAEEYLARVGAATDMNMPLMRNYYLATKRIYHTGKGEYEEALAVDAQLKDYYARKGEALMYNSKAVDMRESLKALGRYEEATILGDEIMELSDSLYNTEHLKQLNELRTIYEVDKLQAQKQRQQIMIISISAGCLLLAVIIAIYVIYSLSLKRKTISLYNQIQGMTRAEKEAERILELIPGAELSREMKLFRELTHLMHSEKLFLDPEVDRRSVATKLGTNEKYLANAIHEGAANATFAGYISGLRLAYSLDLLTGNPDMTLEAVAQESGHGSYSPFFKAFVKKYGMSPSEYRKIFSGKPLSSE